MTSDELTKLFEDDQFKKRVYAYLKRCNLTGEDAKDAVQTALVACLSCPKHLDEIDNPITYIGRLACWRGRDQRRCGRRAIPRDGSPSLAFRPFLFRTDVYLALSHLNEEDRWLIEEHFFEGASYGELEKLTGISRDNLHARVRRSLRRMRRYLERPVEPLSGGPNNIESRVLIPRKTVQPDVGKTRQKCSTMSA